MKKILMMMLVASLMMVSSVGFAANDGKDLAKQQKVVETFIDVFDGEPVPMYSQVASGFSDNLKGAVTEEAFNNLQKQVRQKLGNLKEAKLFAFQRFDQGDRVTYMASFSREKLVSMVFVFDKENKLVNFAFNPIQQKEAKN